MKILHIYAGPYPTSQGTQVLINQVCSSLSKRDCDVHLLTYAHGQRHHPLPYKIHRISNFIKFDKERSGPDIKKLFLDFQLVFKIKHLISKIKPDVVHAHHYEALLAARTAEPSKKIPLVFHMHALLGPELPFYFNPKLTKIMTLAGRAIDRTLTFMADHVVVLSDEMADEVRLMNYPADKTTIVRPFLNQQTTVVLQDIKKQISRNTKYALYIGNLDAYQEIDKLLRGFALAIKKDNLDLILKIVTDSDISSLKSTVNFMKLSKYVHFYSHGTFQNAKKHFLNSLFIIIPRTKPGGVPVKLVNALNFGLPVMMDKRLGQSLIHKKNVFFADMDTPLSIASGLSSLSNNSPLLKKISKEAIIAHKEMFDEKKNVSKLCELYKNLTRQDN